MAELTWGSDGTGKVDFSGRDLMEQFKTWHGWDGCCVEHFWQLLGVMGPIEGFEVLYGSTLGLRAWHHSWLRWSGSDSDGAEVEE